MGNNWFQQIRAIGETRAPEEPILESGETALASPPRPISGGPVISPAPPPTMHEVPLGSVPGSTPWKLANDVTLRSEGGPQMTISIGDRVKTASNTVAEKVGSAVSGIREKLSEFLNVDLTGSFETGKRYRITVKKPDSISKLSKFANLKGQKTRYAGHDVLVEETAIADKNHAHLIVRIL